MPSIQFYAMGCQMHAILESAASLATVELARVPAWFAAWEHILSRFREDSELSALNRRAGDGWVQVSETLWQVLTIALSAARRSRGLVTPTILPALEEAGYDRSFADLPRQMSAASSAVAQPATGDWQAIRMDRRRRAVALPPATRLDLGGIAKGWAADTAAQRLSVFGPALVDAGGDIAVRGARAGGAPWPIGIADPQRPDEHLELLLLASGGVATSGRDVRRWRRGGRENHHIIDPRSGAPADTDVLSATVIAPSAREAEVGAKTALILGSDAGRTWLAMQPHMAGLLVTEYGQVIRTPGLTAYCWNERSSKELYHDGGKSCPPGGAASGKQHPAPYGCSAGGACG